MAVLVLIDAEEKDFCPAKKGPELLERAKSAASHIPIGLVLVKLEFEAWFLANAESLAGWRGLPSTSLEPSPDPDSIRDAKSG